MSIKKDYTYPLVVRVDGKEFSLTSTNDKNDELHEYLRGLISVDKEGVRKYCDTHYELLGYTWYELMHEYIDRDYDYLVYAIANNYVDYIWNTCVFGMTFDGDEFFDVTAEWVSGGYGMAKMRAETKGWKSNKSTKKSYPYSSDDLYEKLTNYIDWIDSCDMMESIYDNDYAHYTSLMNALTDAQHYFETEEYGDALDCLYTFNNILDDINSDWDIEQLNPDEISEIILALSRFTKSAKKMKKLNKMKKANSGERFKQVITDWINEKNEAYRKLNEELGFDDEGPMYDMYSFHDYDDRIEFSFDGPLYDALNNTDGYGWDVRNSLKDRLRDAGLEVVTMDYGVWSHYFASAKKSARKSYVPQYIGFRDMVSKMRNTRDNSKIFRK